ESTAPGLYSHAARRRAGVRQALIASRGTAAGMHGNGALAGVIECAHSEFALLLNTWGNGIRHRDERLTEITALSKITDELRSMGSEVAGIASQTNLDRKSVV